MARHNDVGVTGEQIAAEFLESKGQTVIGRNFRRPYGEIDVITKDSSGAVHFVEVKTVSRETATSEKVGDYFRPEENIHPQKVKRLMRVIESYLLVKDIDTEWQFDVVAVYLNEKTKEARVRYTPDVVLGS